MAVLAIYLTGFCIIDTDYFAFLLSRSTSPHSGVRPALRIGDTRNGLGEAAVFRTVLSDAMMFVIFDIEVVFIVLWALAFRELGVARVPRHLCF